MHNPLTVEDALATLSHSSLPTVITEGRDDYRVLRRIEKRLTDVGVDFMPLSGRGTVLSVWEQLPEARQATVLALVDLDEWLYKGIPDKYIGKNLIYTIGYSIENDILLDCKIEDFLDAHELLEFNSDLRHVCADHAIQIELCKSGCNYKLKRHVNAIINEPDKSPLLTAQQKRIQDVLFVYYRQLMRGKSVFELLVRQTTKKGRHVNLNYHHLYEFASIRPGPILAQLEHTIRQSFE